MKNLKIKKALIPIITSLVLVTTGCSNKTNEVIEDNTITETTENNTSNTNEVENNEETETFDNFATEKKEISDLINSENFEKAKEKGKEFFINAVDFIFYGKEYKGITFDELKEEAKEETLNNFNIIKGWITQIAPDYNTITDIKNKLSDFGTNLGDTIQNKADEWYQNFKNDSKTK